LPPDERAELGGRLHVGRKLLQKAFRLAVLKKQIMFKMTVPPDRRRMTIIAKKKSTGATSTYLAEKE
jgi:hypothetical protein